MSVINLLLASTITQKTPKIDPSTLTTLNHMATNCSWWRSSSVAHTTKGTTVVTQHKVGSNAKALRIRWGVHGWAGASTGLSGRAGLVINGGYYPITWNGNERVTIPDDGKTHTSDPLSDDLIVYAGDTIYSVWQADPGSNYASGNFSMDSPLKNIYDGGYTSVGAFNSTFLSGAPQGIYGLTVSDSKSIVCLGDSILESGWMRRAADAKNIPWTDLSQWAEGIPVISLPARLDPSDPKLFSLGLTEYATNARGTAVDEVKLLLLKQWKWMVSGPIKKLGQTTMVPYVAGVGSGGSTDLSTLDGQVATDKIWRDELNAWLRDGAPITIDLASVSPTGTQGVLRAGQTNHPLVGICDIAAATETLNSRGELVWRVDKGQPSADGIHPTRAGADLMEPVAKAFFDKHL